jgi:hypothetical protein
MAPDFRFTVGATLPRFSSGKPLCPYEERWSHAGLVVFAILTLLSRFRPRGVAIRISHRNLTSLPQSLAARSADPII